MDLQHALHRFKADLEAFIKEEVARQLAVQNSSLAVPHVNSPVVSTASASSSYADVQASLDSLTELAQAKSHAKQSSAVDQLVSTYGSTQTAFVSAAPQSDSDYMSELEMLSQQQRHQADSSAIDQLNSLAHQSTMQSVTEAPSPLASGQMSGIQSFLQKIRERKNLGSN